MEGRYNGKALIRTVTKFGLDADLNYIYILDYSYDVEDERLYKEATAGKRIEDLIATQMKGGMTIISCKVAPGYMDYDNFDETVREYEKIAPEWLNGVMKINGIHINSAKFAAFELTGEGKMILEDVRRRAEGPNILAPDWYLNQIKNIPGYTNGAPSPNPVQTTWTCTCGQVCNSKFCTNCGAKRP